MPSLGTWIAGAVGVAFVAMLIVISVRFWLDIGDAGISGAGWVAMILGVVVTLALGVGLMALVFISNRRGYDNNRRE